MKVYTLLELVEEDAYIIGVFSTHQKALDFWNSKNREGYWYSYLINEFYLDNIEDKHE